MPRGSSYKSEVKKAKDALCSRGMLPSVEAVRIELGNVGSRTTIHKYLKELEVEDLGPRPRASLSDVLQNFAARVAMQLQEDSAAQINTIRDQASEVERRQEVALQELQKKVGSLQIQLENTQAMLSAERDDHECTRRLLPQDVLARHMAAHQNKNGIAE